MPRLFLAALSALAALLLLALPANASSSSGTRLRGTVTAKDAGQNLVSVTSTRRLSVLRVPEVALPRIQVGRRVELRGTTLRSRGRGPTRILARGVVLVSSQPAPAKAEEDVEIEDEVELEVEGTLTSLSPLTVTANGASFTCAVPAGISLSGFAVGDRVEMKCELVGGIQTLRKLELEDNDDDNGNSGPGNADGDDHDGSGGGGDDGGSGGHGGGGGGDD